MSSILGQQKGRRPRVQARTRSVGEDTIPAEYLAHLLEVSRRFQVRSEALLKDTGLSPRMLEEPAAVVTQATFLRVVERALLLTGEPGLGFYHGLSLKLSAHGALGLLAMTSGTLHDALIMAERYAQLRATDLALELHVGSDSFALEFRTRGPLHLMEFFSESMFVMLLQLARALVGHPISARCELPFPEPTYFRRFAHLLPQVKFGASTNRLIAPRALLAEAIVTSDSVMARRIERDCQRELGVLQERASVLHAVRRRLKPETGHYPSLEQVAEGLGSSTRTLKRKLREQGTSFRTLVDDLRRERATTLLRTTDRSLDEISDLLGYADVASLHRSFRRWFKDTPAAYRERRLPARPHQA